MYGAKKDLNISIILQWPSASQLTGGHNKTGIVIVIVDYYYYYSQ